MFDIPSLSHDAITGKETTGAEMHFVLGAFSTGCRWMIRECIVELDAPAYHLAYCIAFADRDGLDDTFLWTRVQ